MMLQGSRIRIFGKIINSRAEVYNFPSLANDYDWTVDWTLPKKLHDIGLTGGEKEWHLRYDGRWENNMYYIQDTHKFRIAALIKGRGSSSYFQRNDTIHWAIEASFALGQRFKPN